VDNLGVSGILLIMLLSVKEDEARLHGHRLIDYNHGTILSSPHHQLNEAVRESEKRGE
jgi:hypothetical protein